TAVRDLRIEIGELLTPALSTTSTWLTTLTTKATKFVSWLREIDALTFSINNGEIEPGLWMERYEAWKAFRSDTGPIEERRARYEQALAEAERRYRERIAAIRDPESQLRDNIPPEVVEANRRRDENQERVKAIAEAAKLQQDALDKEREVLERS